MYYWGVIIATIVVLCYVLKKNSVFFDQYYYIVDKLLAIPILVVIFDYFQKRNIFFRKVMPILCWFGGYTLELYVIHIYLMRFVSDFPLLLPGAEWWIAVPIALLISAPINKFNKLVTDSIKQLKIWKLPT